MSQLDFYPKADIQTTGWTAHGETDCYAAVDDGFEWSDGDSTYVRSATGTSAILFDIGTHYEGTEWEEYLPVNAVNITVTIYIFVRQESNVGAKFQGILKINGTEYNQDQTSGSGLSGTGYSTIVALYSNNPETSGAWSKTAVENIEAAGFYNNYASGSSYIRCTNITVRAEYEEGDMPLMTTDGCNFVANRSSTIS